MVKEPIKLMLSVVQCSSACIKTCGLVIKVWVYVMDCGLRYIVSKWGQCFKDPIKYMLSVVQCSSVCIESCGPVIKVWICHGLWFRVYSK